MKTWKALLCLSAVGLLAGMWASPVSGQTKSPPAKSAAPASSQGAGFDGALLRPATLLATAPETYQVKFMTTKGDFVVKVTRAWAPLGADRFYNLVQHHFYDSASFFRVLPGFVVQFGLSAYPPVSHAWQSATIKDDPVKQSNRRGYLTFATGGPNTRTTQVFINLADNSRLDAMGFSAFGEVVEGMNVVEQLYSGYGEGAPQGRGPRQDLVGAGGKAYLDKEFPKLDSIKTTELIAPEASKPASSGAPPKPTGKTPAKKSS